MHPREHDLVIGTHGRGAYILDDVRPLRGSTADVLTQPVHLFDPPPAYQVILGQPAGYRFTGATMFRGENRRNGAMISYSVADTSARVRAEILDGDDVIRTLQGSRDHGVNRVRWDFRREAGEDGPRVVALPGTYTVRVRVGDTEVTKPLEVRQDPRMNISLADRQEKYDTLVAFGRDVGVLRQITRQIRNTLRMLDPLVTNVLSGSDSTTRALRTQGRELRDALRALREEINPSSSIQGINRDPNSVSAKVSQANSMLQSSWEAPTATEAVYMQQARVAVQALVAKADRVYAQEYAAFRSALQAAQLDPFPAVEPFRPGN